MNTKLYRRSRIYRAFFLPQLSERKSISHARHRFNLHKGLLQIAMEIYSDDFAKAIKSENYKGALEAEANYLYYAEAYRELVSAGIKNYVMFGLL